MIKFSLLFIAFLLSHTNGQTQPAGNMYWKTDGAGYYTMRNEGIGEVSLPANKFKLILSKREFTPAGDTAAMQVQSFSFSPNGKLVLLFTNTRQVWRYNTRGDYWLADTDKKTLVRLGKNLPPSSLMFAKFSPDGQQVAYVSRNNIYVQGVDGKAIKQLTTDGREGLINGTFDWAYEEEFFCRDGFRWSPDSRQIAYWQIDARKVKRYLMLNTTDSIYPFNVPVEYPVSGEMPSPFKIGVVDVGAATTRWMNIATDPVLQSYVPRMEWAANSTELIIQHLNRMQNHSTLMLCDVRSGSSRKIYEEKDSAWIDVQQLWDQDYAYGGWDWLNNGSEFLWPSEKDGWRHLYRISRDGKKEQCITNGSFDVIELSAITEKDGYVYYYASPENATQKYLYRSLLNGKGEPERITPLTQPGTHEYNISPTASFATHRYSSASQPWVNEMVSLPGHRVVITSAAANAFTKPLNISFFSVTAANGVTMDGWKVLPENFDATKKYPVVFYVYTEPWGQTVKDAWGTGINNLYRGSMAADGYIYISIDNRGTPAAKGRAWRKSIYQNIGTINIDDQAAAAREILKWPYVDTSRIAVWGWSGGGTATLNLMFRYPEIYKTGIAIAAVANQLTYDNIYQERYMGLPQLNKTAFVRNSPVTHAKNLRGSLLYIHGTGDDNVHYNNAEMLINELVKYNKQFQLMAYPNRSHSISEGEGTSQHLSTLFTQYLQNHCPPGPR